MADQMARFPESFGWTREFDAPRSAAETRQPAVASGSG
jgi:hypothetical protein